MRCPGITPINPHLVIVGFDYDRKPAKFFRSNAASLAGSGGQSWLGATFLDDMKGTSKPREVTLAEAVQAFRMSPVIQPVRSSPRDTWVLPPDLNIEDFLAIQKLELDAIDKDDVGRLVTAGKLWIEGKFKNQAIRDKRHYECQIGHDGFASAVSAWRTLSADTRLTPPPART